MKKNEDLIKKANDSLHDGRVDILKNKESVDIKDSYNGQTAAFAVTVAMSGLRPAMAIYQKSTGECEKIHILNASAVMMGVEGDNPGKTLFREILDCDDEQLKRKKKEIIDCSIALKQVIRTYNLVKE
jgi:hypothetical protein